MSGLPSMSQATAVAVSVAAAAAVLVVDAISEIATASTPIVLPGLKPNQPNQSTKQPIVARRHVVAGNGVDFAVWPYLPIRGPRMYTPANAAQPPIECTDRRAGEIDEAPLRRASRHPKSSGRRSGRWRSP